MQAAYTELQEMAFAVIRNINGQGHGSTDKQTAAGNVTCIVRHVYKHGPGTLVPQVSYKLNGKRIAVMALAMKMHDAKPVAEVRCTCLMMPGDNDCKVHSD